MTRPAQNTPASPRAESGSAGEETASTATVAQPQPQPQVESTQGQGEADRAKSRGTQAKPDAEAGTSAAAPEAAAPESAATESAAPEAAAKGRTTGPEPAAETAPGSRSESEAESNPDSDSESDPGAAAEAKSRLPALVRTMTATAIDRPQQQAAPVGRPGKAVLAGAAVAGALLVSVPFLVLTGGDDKDARTAPAGGTVLGDGAQEAPGDFVVTKPDTGTPDDDEKRSGKPDKPVKQAPGGGTAQGSGKETPKQDGGGKEQPKGDTGKQDEPATSGGGKTSGGGAADQPANPGPGVTFSAPVSVRSHLSGRCLDVPNADFGDGKKLFVWDCNNGVAQKWQFASDGTMRIQGLCLDVANANYNDGTPIQIARCSGNAAQKFVLNERHDLVNTVVGKCVDIKDNNTGNGAWLQLWTCAGTDNQKWSV
ncbi:ricin-type beta-trefoil lectin domain protein [Streptomyces sp. bgisy034]|uniref:ricin-type beta-trefoil lectin domain protein n=1 Tax=Streptomyces sp. bgisy034 TaxID=3413774 RepID=UPI003EBDFA94